MDVALASGRTGLAALLTAAGASTGPEALAAEVAARANRSGAAPEVHDESWNKAQAARKKRGPCWRFTRGECNYDDRCKFSHDPDDLGTESLAAASK